MEQMPRRSLRSATLATKPKAPEPDYEDESEFESATKRSSSLNKKKHTTIQREDVPVSKSSQKKARLALNDRMTSTGVRADLSKHALGHLLVASPAILSMLSTRDARHLRRADKVLRSIVAEHPWDDLATPILRTSNITEWRASFPTAIGCNMGASFGPSKTTMAILADMTSITIGGSFRSKSDFELPLSFVRSMPRLVIIRAMVSIHVPPGAAVWTELGGLRELTLKFSSAPPPANLLSHLGSLRLLDLTFWDHVSEFSPGLAAVPLLETLSLRGPANVVLAEGRDLVHLTRLNSLSIACSTLPPNVLAQVAPTLRILSLKYCDGVTDATFAPPVLAYLRELTVYTEKFYNHRTAAVTSDALVGLASLEVFRTSGYRHLVSQKALSALGCMERLKRLLWSQEDGEFRALIGLKSLTACPITEIDLSGSARRGQTLKSSQIARLPHTLRTLRYSGTVTGEDPWSSLTRIVTLDLSESENVFDSNCFASIVDLRTLKLARCRNVSREALLTLPVGLTSLTLDCCSHLDVDDELLLQLRLLLPDLSHLSLAHALVSEVDPVFADPALAESRLKTPEQVRRHILSIKKKAKAARAAKEDGESSDVDGSDAEAEGDAGLGGGGAGGTSTKRRRRLSAKKARTAARYAYLGTPPHTSVVGWTALLRLPRGLYSLDVHGNDLSYDSYALLRLHVAELSADKVKSPEEAVVAEERRSLAAEKRAEKRAVWEAAAVAARAAAVAARAAAVAARADGETAERAAAT